MALDFPCNEFLSVSLSILLIAKPLENNKVVQSSHIPKCLEV